MAVYGPGDIDPSTGQPYPDADQGLTLNRSGPTAPGGGIGSDANFPLTGQYGPPHAGGSPTNPIIPDPSQSGGNPFGQAISNIKNWFGGGDGQPAASPLPTGSPSGAGGIGSDANFPLTGGGAAPQMGMPWAGNNNGQPLNAPAPGGMPWAGNNAGRPYGVGAPGRAPVNMGHGAPGVVAPHPAIQAAAARAAAGQPASPFTMVLRPNAPANNQGGRGGGGTPLATALDLSGWRPQAAAPAAAPAPRTRVAGPLAKNALPRRAAPAPYPVTGSGSPTPLIYQHGGVGPATRPGLVGYGGAGVTQNDLDQIGVTQMMPP